MDLGQVYGIVSALGSLIGVVDKLITDLRAHGVQVPDSTTAALVAAKDAHAQLAATTGNVRT